MEMKNEKEILEKKRLEHRNRIRATQCFIGDMLKFADKVDQIIKDKKVEEGEKNEGIQNEVEVNTKINGGQAAINKIKQVFEDVLNEKFLEAAENGDLAEVKECIEAEVDVNVKDKNGWTALIWAVCRDHKEVVEILIDAGADVNVKENWGITVLMKATNYTKEIVELLIKAGADVNAKGYCDRTALIDASLGDKKEIIELLIKAGADVNAKTSADWDTALQFACVKGNNEIVELLIENGADVNAKDIAGHTALTVASGNHHEKIVELLKKHGAKE